MKWQPDNAVKTQRPEPYQDVIATTPQSRCLAWISRAGTWYCAHSGEPLYIVTDWQPINAVN